MFSPETASVLAEIVQQPSPAELLQRLYPVLDEARADLQRQQDALDALRPALDDAQAKYNRLEAAKAELQAAEPQG